MRSLDNKNDQGSLKRRRFLRKSKDYLKGTHLFKLERGGELTEEARIMTGQESKVLNLDMQKDFCESVRIAIETGTKNQNRLARWVCIQRDVNTDNE